MDSGEKLFGLGLVTYGRFFSGAAQLSVSKDWAVEMPGMWPQVEAQADQVRSVTIARQGNALALVHDAIGIYAEAVTLVPRSGTSPALIVQNSFLAQALNTLSLASHAMACGYYFQTIGMARFLLECWAVYWFVQAHPKESECWFVNESGKKPPKVETMLKRIDHPTPHTKAQASAHRSMLNRFAHTDSAAISHLIEQDGDDIVIRWGVTYNDGKFKACVLAMAAWVGSLLDARSRAVPDGHEWHGRHQAVAARLIEYIDTVQKEMKDAGAR